jgi:hypothetical protein
VGKSDANQVKFSPKAVAAEILENYEVGDIGVAWQDIAKDPTRTDKFWGRNLK